MRAKHMTKLAAGVALALSQLTLAGTEPYFTPLTGSAPVTLPNSAEEINEPWVVPAGITQWNLTSLNEVESQAQQSVVRVPGLGTGASMFDMIAFDDQGEFIFIPHETLVGAGVSRYDIANDETTVIFNGDLGGLEGDWSNDWGAFDPSTWTPKGTLLLAEEWSGTGRVMEVKKPLADPAKDIGLSELKHIPKVAHEGLRFSKDGKTLYFVDEWNSGSIYKAVFQNPNNYQQTAQIFVLKVDAYAGEAADYYYEPGNAGQPRTGAATWVPMTNKGGHPLTSVDPFKPGPSNDPRTSDDTRGGRPAADELGATPYGRPEDIEVGTLASGNEVLYFAATSEAAVYAVEELGNNKANVTLFAKEAVTPKNVGFPGTSGVMNSPDNLAQDADGNIYIIEDAPNGSSTGGDVWFARDVDNDGVAESLDHFLSIRVDGSEATGMIFNPANPDQFAIAVQHPDSTDLDQVPNGQGDAVWMFDISGADAP